MGAECFSLTETFGLTAVTEGEVESGAERFGFDSGTSPESRTRMRATINATKALVTRMRITAVAEPMSRFERCYIYHQQNQAIQRPEKVPLGRIQHNANELRVEWKIERFLI